MLAAIRQWVIKTMTKGQTGVVTTMPKQEIIEMNVQITAERIMRNGINPNDLKTVGQVENVVKQIDEPRVISADSAEGRGITEQLLGKKKADVLDMEGNKISDGAKIMGGKQVESDAVIKARLDADNKKGIAGIKISLVDDSIAKIKSMEPIEAMKEANLVAGKKGRYANLDDNQVKKIMDDTEDHIFERDIPEEDFATGGRAGYKSGLSVLGFTPEHAAAVDEMDKNFTGSQFDYAAASTKDMVDRASNPLTAVASAVGNVVGRPAYDFVDAAQKYSDKGYQGEFSLSPQGAIDFGKNMLSLGGQFLDEKPGTMMAGALKGGIQSLGTQLGEGIYNTFNPEEKEEDPYADIKGQTAGLGVASFLVDKFGPKIGAAIFKAGKNKTNSYIGKNIVKPGIDKTIKKIKDRKITTTTKPGSGGNIVSGGGGDRDFSVKGPDTSANPKGKSNQASSKRGYALHGAEGGLAKFADGGRIGYKVGSVDKMRRLILKAMGAGTVGIGAAKSGIFSGFGKGAGKTVAKEVAQQTTSSMPPPYFFKLAEKIKKMGDDATATTDRTIAKTLDSKDGKSTYLLEEDVTTGDTIIKKINKEGDEMITDIEIMELKKGEVVMGKDGKPIKVPDEYEEVTEANARIEGDVFNDPYYSDGIQVDEIIKEVDDKVPSIKYASGGLAYMLGE